MSDDEWAITDLTQRVEKLEMQMASLLRAQGLGSHEAPAWAASPEVMRLLMKGEKIQAIKAFRMETGASLADAKTYIESLGG